MEKSAMKKSKSFRLGHAVLQWRLARLAWRTARLFHESRCPLWASALTYYSIFAVVPMVALFVGVAKGFGLEQWVNSFLTEKLSAHQEMLKQIMVFVESALREARGGWVAGIGVIVLLYTVIAMIRHIETAFNTVLGIKQGRNILRIFTDYLSLVFILPLLLVLSGSASLMFNRIGLRLMEHYPLLHNLSTPLVLPIKLLSPWLLSSLVLAILYIVLSNGRVKLYPALLGGFTAAVLMRLLQSGYVLLQVNLTSYNAIYGSFSALPLFLIWLYLSWNVLMVGISLAAAAQGMRTKEFDEEEVHDDSVVAGIVNRRVLLLISTLVVQDFAHGRTAPGDESLAERCGIGLRRMRQALQLLIEARLLNKVFMANGEIGYTPVLPPERMTTCEVLSRLDQMFPPLHPEQSHAKEIATHLYELDQVQQESGFNRKLTEL